MYITILVTVTTNFIHSFFTYPVCLMNIYKINMNFFILSYPVMSDDVDLKIWIYP